MTDLERRALLGDVEAQRECTEKGIVLPCPFCNGKVFCALPSEFFCTECGLKFCFPAGFTPEKCFEKYNTRTAPSIRRCNGCLRWGGFDEYGDGYCKNQCGIDNIASPDGDHS